MSENQPSRPDRVTTAVALLYITLVICGMRAVMDASRLLDAAPPIGIGILMIIAILILCILWFLIHMIGKGRNWARMSYLAVFTVELLLSIKPLLESFAAYFIDGVLGMILLILQSIAIVFLFQKSSSDWFKISGGQISKRS